jgi:dipeptide/tripeptide permease
MTEDQDHPAVRKVVGKIPFNVWIVAVIAFAERFCFYGLTAPFRK